MLPVVSRGDTIAASVEASWPAHGRRMRPPVVIAATAAPDNETTAETAGVSL
jgi:hypothetical protein